MPCFKGYLFIVPALVLCGNSVSTGLCHSLQGTEQWSVADRWTKSTRVRRNERRVVLTMPGT